MYNTSKVNRNEIGKIFRKGLQQNNHLIRKRRIESYDDLISNLSKQPKKETNWGYSPTSRTPIRPFKPQRLSEQKDDFYTELDEIIKELEDD